MQMVGDIIGEPLQNYHIVDKKKLKDEVMYLLNCVGMSGILFINMHINFRRSKTENRYC